jgi:CRISPR-associated protein Cst1
LTTRAGAHPSAKQSRADSKTPTMAPLAWTGHALVDAGLAGLLAFAEKTEPAALTPEDLDRAADFMVESYYSGKLLSYLTCVFMNASFVQPKEGRDKREAFISHYLRAHRAAPHPDVAGLRCVFSGEPATSPMVRTHLPLFSGEGVLNFRPNGETAVPVAGAYVVALMFLPLAARRSEGKLLAVWADDPALTLRFARRYLEDNRRLLRLVPPANRLPVIPGCDRELPSWDQVKRTYKYADVKGPRSLVIADLAALASEAMPSDLRPKPSALTAYLLSNSGQGPSLEIFVVPSGVITFVLRARGALTRDAWQDIAERFRPVKEAGQSDLEAATGRRMRRGGKTAATTVPGRPGWSKNPAFEDLCAIFENGFTDRRAAAAWLRRHLLGRIERQKAVAYEAMRSRSWDLADLFLQEVLGMNKGEIEAIRVFADRLAGWIDSTNDRKLHHALAFERPRELRGHLLRVQRESAKGKLLFGMDEYASVWLHPDRDEYLVRDLVCLRVVERLHALEWYSQHPEEILETGQAGALEEEVVS